MNEQPKRLWPGLQPANNKNVSLKLEKLLDLPAWRFKQCGRWLTIRLSWAIKHRPDKEDSIFKVFKNSVAMLFMIKKSQLFKKKILSMLGSLPKNNWTTFLGKLSILNDPNTLIIELLQILLQELILREKVCQPFWKPVYKKLSENLLLPMGIDFVDLDSNSSKLWCQKQVEKLQYLTIQTTKHLNKNSQKTYWQSFISSHADKWENIVIPIVKLKTLKIKLHPTIEQKKILDKFIDTARYVYNRTLEHIKNGHKSNFYDLRDLLVTENTKKNLDEYKEYDNSINDLRKLKKDANAETKNTIDEKIKIINAERRNVMKQHDSTKNNYIKDFELETPKDIRACAVKQCCDAFKSGFKNLRNGNIKYFNMKYKKKNDKVQIIEVPPQLVSLNKETSSIKLYPGILKTNIKVAKHDIRKIEKINNNVDIQRINKDYYICINIETNTETCNLERIAGVDLGIRTLATVHTTSNTETTITEYKHRVDLIKKYNQKIKLLKTLKRIRKKHFDKLDKNKINFTNRLHWDFINRLLSVNDVIYLGDIKSHDIVKNGKNKTLNLAFNDLKFYQLKQRMIYKASISGKKVILVPEHYTTKTCSCCGVINESVGSKEVFSCSKCNLKTGRDMNASKNMKMKGLLI